MKLLRCLKTLPLLLIVLVILINNAEWLRNEEKPNCYTYSTLLPIPTPHTSRDDSLLWCSLDSRLMTVVMTALLVMPIFFDHSECHNFQLTHAYTARHACLNHSYITMVFLTYMLALHWMFQAWIDAASATHMERRSHIIAQLLNQISWSPLFRHRGPFFLLGRCFLLHVYTHT